MTEFAEPFAEEKPLAKSGRDRVSELLGAGFEPQEISAWATNKRTELSYAGFTQPEIDDYIGNQPKMSGPFFDRMVKGATLRPDTMPTMQQELNRGLARSSLSFLATAPQMYAHTITRIGETLGIQGIAEAGKLGTAALEADKAAADQALAPGVPSASEIQGANDAAHYVVGKIGETVPVIAEYLTLGVPRMVVLGAYNGALRASTQTNGDRAATATGAAIGATLAGAQIPFLNGAVGKGLLDTIVKSVLGNAAVSVAGAYAERLPKAVAGMGYEPPSVGEVGEAAATGAVGGAVFGAHSSLAKTYQQPTGERLEQPIGTLPTAEGINTAKQAVLPGVVAPQAHNAIERAYTDHGIHPAEIAMDANRDVTISQDLAAGKVPEAYLKKVPGKPITPAAVRTEGAAFEDPLVLARRGELTAERAAQIRDDLQTLTPAEVALAKAQIGEHVDPKMWAAIAENLQKAESSRTGATAVVADQLGYLGTSGQIRTASEREAAAVIGRAMQAEAARGGDIASLIDDAMRARHSEGAMPAEAAAQKQRLLEMHAAGTETLAARTEPTAYEPTPPSAAAERVGDAFRDVLKEESGAVPLPTPPTPPSGPPQSQQEARNRVLSRLSIGETDGGRPWSWSRLYTAVIDRLHPIAEATRLEGGKLPTSEDPYQLARLYAGVSGKADHFLNYGTFDFASYKNTGKSLQEILAPVRGDLDGFRSFATSLRALELEGRGIKTGIDLDAARMEAKAGAAKYAPVMAELIQYQNRLAGYLRDAGVLSADGYDAMVKANPVYMPFQRVFGDVAGDVMPEVIRGPAGRTLQAQNPIHEIVGSERRIIDPLESVIRNTYLALAMAERNTVGTKLVDLIQRAGNLPEPERAGDITIFRDGKKETYRVSEDLANAMKGLDEESVNTMLRVLGAPARMLRAGATLTPDFIARNVIRDFFGAVINTTKGVFSPLDTAKGLIGVISKDKDFQEWLKGGGAQATMVGLDRRYLQQDLAQLTAETGLMTRGWNVIRHPIDTLRTISEVVEQATRLGEFKGARRQELAAGATEKEATQAAAYTAREVTLDFARRGAQTRAMNMITAFWNAQVQGVDRFARAVKDDPAGTMFKVAAGITLPSVLLWFNNKDDPRYQELPQWQKDLFWIIPTQNTIYRIPKPFEVGIVFGSGVERLLDAFYAQRPDAFRGFAKSIAGALMPSAVPTAALPIVEQWANRSSFTDRTLIPANTEKLLPEYQYTPYTTEAAKKIGEILGAFPGLREMRTEPDAVAGGVARALTTPILMENYIRAWTGGLGMYVMQAADSALRKAGVLPDPPKPQDTLADIPFIKAFVVRYPSASAESIQRFHDDYAENKRYFDTFMAKAKEGDVAAAQRVFEMGGPNMFVQLDRLQKVLANQSKVARDIYKNPDMSPEEKRQQLDTLYFGMIQIAQTGNEAMRAAKRSLSQQ